jgi:prepilin-type N-terminal cleavage/methylation domain-containing protein
MNKKQHGFGVVEIVIVVAVLAVIAMIGWGLVSRPDSSGAETVNDTENTLVTFEGKVTQINHQEGACLAYQIDNNIYAVAECPGMDGVQEGFVGTYDKDIAVGDKVTVRGNPKNTKNATHQTYHLDKPGTYLRLAN